MKVKSLALLLLITAATAFAQQAQSNSGGNNTQVQTSAPPAVQEKSALEQKAYEDAMAAVQKQKDKEEADKKKAAADAEAKKRASFVTYSALERAMQENMAERNRPRVKELRKLLIEKQKLLDRVAVIDQKLNAGNQQVVAVEKIQPDDK